ncbi:MAG TPA: penicillin-binding transpeptidase domain-containing protein, partial [Armatimonadota bacterium]
LLSVLIARGFKIALHARTDFDRFLASGLTVLLGIQSVVIVYGVLGILPLTGVTLPFVSYGKSSLLSCFFLAGLLLSISGDGVKDISGVHPATVRALKWLATGMLVLLLGVAGIGRLLFVQGLNADQIAGRTIDTPDADGYTRPHVNPRLKAIEAAIPRGSIYDRNGLVLATSRTDELTGMNAEDLIKRPKGRYFPYGSAFAHIVGYVDPKCGGPGGIESSRNGELRGFADYSELLPIYRQSHMPNTPQLKGKDVRLTIDAKLQESVERALIKYTGELRDRRTGERKHKAAAVVIDVYSGEILACASIPDFDPNALTPGIWKSYNKNENHESVLVNRAVNGLYPPGSTFKLVTATGALENGLSPSYTCRHQEYGVRWTANGHNYSRKRITDEAGMQPHGLTNLAKAVRVSCNVFFAHLGIDLGADKLYDTARKYGLSRIPPPKKLGEDLPDNAYGQGVIEVTPLEMARVVAAIANDGVMMKPHFVKEITSGNETLERIQPEEMGRPLSKESAAILQKMMADVTKNGTARGVFDGLSVAGKTGSAENDHADRMAHSWFVGFAPIRDPRIAFAVVVENGGHGRSAAGPICREIVKAAL